MKTHFSLPSLLLLWIELDMPCVYEFLGYGARGVFMLHTYTFTPSCLHTERGHRVRPVIFSPHPPPPKKIIPAPLSHPQFFVRVAYYRRHFQSPFFESIIFFGRKSLEIILLFLRFVRGSEGARINTPPPLPIPHPEKMRK